MANELSDLIPKLLAQGLMALRGATVMPRLVNNDYAPMFKEKGNTVDVPIPSAIAAQAVTAGATPPATADIQPSTVPITLDQWQEAPFYLTDTDLQKSMNGTIPMQASEAIGALASGINAFIFGKMAKSFYGYTGTAGTTPFGSNTSEATQARKNLTKQLAPLMNRRMVLDPDAEANALELRAFQDASFRADAAGIIEGTIGRKLGFDFAVDQQVPTHTAGTITTSLIAKAATPQAVGLKSVVVTTAAATGAIDLKEGDIIEFAGDDQTYVLTADVAEASASTDATLLINPGLKIALAGSEAVTVKASHVVNLAFHRDAFAFASRPLLDIEGLGSMIQQAVDPVSGLALRLEVSREHKRTRFSYDILYGGETVRAELGSRVAG